MDEKLYNIELAGDEARDNAYDQYYQFQFPILKVKKRATHIMFGGYVSSRKINGHIIKRSLDDIFM